MTFSTTKGSNAGPADVCGSATPVGELTSTAAVTVMTVRPAERQETRRMAGGILRNCSVPS